MTPLEVVILAGGRGTRLGNLTNNTPKPLLAVAGKPFITHLLIRLARAGLTDIGVLTGQFEDKFRTALGDGSEYGVALTFVPEPEPAGTGGALRYVRDKIGEEFICLNGDSLFNIDFRTLADRPLAPETDFEICLRRVEDTRRYGRVELADSGLVTRFGEKQASGPGLINTGIYRIRSTVVAQLKPQPASLETEILPMLIKQERVTGRVRDAPFLDIGIPSDFARAGEFIETLES